MSSQGATQKRFCYTEPMISPENENRRTLLKLERIAPKVYALLQAIDRTGWKNRGVENPETVKEHTEALLALAEELQELLTEEEWDGLMEMLEVHDWPEAIHGDEVILEIDPVKRKALKEVKFKNEKRALETICADLTNGEEIVQLWLRFEHSDDPAAKFGRQLDKYQAVEKALEYEQSQGIPLFESFLGHALNFIDHPVLLARIEQLKAKWAAGQ